jgi:uncharacterized pyridoxal phosphate-containing UPF0001 family protein
MPGLIHGLDPARIALNLERAWELAGERVEILAATKYVPVDEMGALAEAGVRLVGENRQRTSRRSTSDGAARSSGTSSATSRAARSSSCCRSAA